MPFSSPLPSIFSFPFPPVSSGVRDGRNRRPGAVLSPLPPPSLRSILLAARHRMQRKERSLFLLFLFPPFFLPPHFFPLISPSPRLRFEKNRFISPISTRPVGKRGGDRSPFFSPPPLLFLSRSWLQGNQSGKEN